jgi:hypothetical protein
MLHFSLHVHHTTLDFKQVVRMKLVCVIACNVAQDFATISIDPCEDKVSLESLVKYDQIQKNFHLKTAQEKRLYTLTAIFFMLESSKIPKKGKVQGN